VCSGPLAFRNRCVHRDVNARQQRVGVNCCSSAGFAGATDLWGGSEGAVEAPFDDLGSTGGPSERGREVREQHADHG
jgi:hypothetical protein